MMPFGAENFPSQLPDGVPSKVIAAMDFLRFCDSRQNPPSYGEMVREGVSLSPLENTCYDTALGVLLEYFSQAGFGSHNELRRNVPPQEPPPLPQKAIC